MKLRLLGLVAATALLASCHKDDDGDYISNTWMVNGVIHTVVNNTRPGGNFIINVNDGVGTTGSGLTFLFASEPKSGAYTLVDVPTQPGEVAIAANEGSVANIYRSTAGEARKLQVNVDGGGHATLYLQGAMLQSLFGTGDTVNVTASIRENQ